MRHPLAIFMSCLALAACAARIVPARPVRPLASLFSSDDYPADPHSPEGRVAVTLEIGTDGRVAACRVTQSSGSSALDSATCRIFRVRARFTPARDMRGVAVPSQHQTAVRWTVPES